MCKFVKARIFENPLPGIEPRVERVRVGTPLKDIVKGCTAPMVCIVDGIPLKREYWMQRKVCNGDNIEFHAIYLGGNGGGGSRSILAIVATIALAYFAPMLVASWGGAFVNAAGGLSILGRVVASGIVLLGNALISAVIMPKPSGNSANNQGERASSVYSVDTQGNTAKVFSPIPVQYGRLKSYPCYASQPYSEYKTHENPDGDQYYYAVFCLGQGEYDVEGVYIADAPITSFKDVFVSRILPPGQMPQDVNATRITSDAVSGQSLDAMRGGKMIESVGPFPTCSADRKVKKAYVDIVCPRGLYKMNDQGKAQQISRRVRITFNEINSRGKPVDLGFKYTFDVTLTAASITPQRRTFAFDLPPARYNVSMVRLDTPFDPKETTMADSLQWASLSCELVDAAPLCKTATHYELVMRASEQLSSLSQRKIAIVATRKVKDFEGNLVATRSPVLAMLDKWTNPVYGDGLPMERIDLETLRRYYDVCNMRQDWFDYLFENRITSNEADQLIARVFRSAALQRNGTRTIIRDELVDMPVTLFNPQNTTEGSVTIDYMQITEETADGVIVEYFDHFLWDWVDIECPAPGFTYTSSTAEGYDPSLPEMSNPVRVTLDGITGWHQAKREGTYLAHTNTLRRRFLSWDTEMQGILVHYGAGVLFSSTLYNAGNGGEVADYRDSDGAIRLTGDTTDADRLVFMIPDGTLTPPLNFRSVGDGWIIIEGGTADYNYLDYKSERTKYVALKGDIVQNIVKVTSLEPHGMSNNGAPAYTLHGVVDVPEVHTCDNQWLPKEGEIQDDYNEPDPTPGPVTNPITLGSYYNVVSQRATWPNSGYPPTLKFYADGRVTMKYFNTQKGTIESTMNLYGEEIQYNWYRGAPIPGIGQNYNVRIMVALDPAYDPYIAHYDNDFEPRAPIIFEGQTFWDISYDGGDEIMREGGLALEAYNDLKARFPGRHIWFSPTVIFNGKTILSQDVELKGVYNGFPGLPTPVIEGYLLISQHGAQQRNLAKAPLRMSVV